jgi:poly(3-hydroxybutyrate) depolymerase
MRCQSILPPILIRTAVALAVTMLVTASRASEPQAGFVSRSFKDDAGEHKYMLFVPVNYNPARKWPVILFLHGAGERGTDGIQPTTIGLGPLIRERMGSFPFIAVFPQCEDVKGRVLVGWEAGSPDAKRALAILDEVEQDFRVDPEHRILTGWSMGGYGAWSIAAARPDHWSAVVPVAGGGNPDAAAKLKDVSVWAIHGATDMAILPEETRKMIDALKKADGKPRHTVVDGVGHDVWRVAYDSDELFEWMLNPKAAADNPTPKMAPRKEAAKVAAAPGPFVPALEIPSAVTVRLGNEMLESLADSIPKAVPPDMLKGVLNDMYDSTSAEGINFGVTLSGISYTGQVSRAKVQAYRPDRVNVQIGLQNVQITISGAYVAGGGRSAGTGPIAIVIGHQRPCWISLDVTPYIENRRLRLKHVATLFNIPNDNWYVTNPAGVWVRGLGMNSERVSSGLVSGLYGQKGRIEGEIVALVPRIVKQLEEKLDIGEISESVTNLWPLPVYRPQVRVWPESISTDATGVSLVLGVTAAAIDPKKPPKQIQRAAATPIPASSLRKSTKLEVGLAPQILGPLSEMLIESDVARINVLDTPGQTLARLADPKTLVEAIPELKKHGENVQLVSEIVLASPIRVGDAPSAEVASKAGPNGVKGGGPDDAGVDKGDAAAGDSPRQVEFRIPRLRLLISIQNGGNGGRISPFAEFEIDVKQKADPRLLKPSPRSRVLTMVWDENPQFAVEGGFSADYKPDNSTVDHARIKKLIEDGWKRWTQSGPMASTSVPDVDLGFTKLRISDLEWASPLFLATFGPPGVRISNSFDQPLVYEMKGPYSGWGGPYTLAPGEDHYFPITYPVIFRRKLDGQQAFTLPVGSHSEFRKPMAGGSPALFEAREPGEG